MPNKKSQYTKIISTSNERGQYQKIFFSELTNHTVQNVKRAESYFNMTSSFEAVKTKHQNYNHAQKFRKRFSRVSQM